MVSWFWSFKNFDYVKYVSTFAIWMDFAVFNACRDGDLFQLSNHWRILSYTVDICLNNVETIEVIYFPKKSQFIYPCNYPQPHRSIEKAFPLLLRNIAKRTDLATVITPYFWPLLQKRCKRNVLAPFSISMDLVLPIC